MQKSKEEDSLNLESLYILSPNFTEDIDLFWLSPYPSVLDFWEIKFEKSSSKNWIFTACVACKNQFHN